MWWISKPDDLITKLQLATFTNRDLEFSESVKMVFGEGKHKHRSTYSDEHETEISNQADKQVGIIVFFFH